MFNIGLPEILFILVVALILYGPAGLPKAGASVGKTFGEFRKAFDELSRGEKPDDPK